MVVTTNHRGVYEPKWFVLLRTGGRIQIEYYDTDEEAWKEYRYCLFVGGNVQFGEQYLFIPEKG